MTTTRNSLRRVIAGTCVLLMAHSASALDILLTNDDGFDSEGIIALHESLVAAGHNVTLVGPATQQSGKGGSINTGVFSSYMPLVHHGDGVWSLAGSPVDAVKAGLDVLLKDNPPDLVVSGLNEGENIGKPGANMSGTEGAALQAAFRGIPSIAASVQVSFAESGSGFPSTVAAYAPAADFVTRTIASLEVKNGSAVLPKHVRMLNINFPVPYGEIRGVKVTKLANGSGLELPLYDASEGFPAFGVPEVGDTSCVEAGMVEGGQCLAGVGLGFSPAPDPVMKSDLNALRNRYITVTPYDIDLTGPKTELEGLFKAVAP